jgi:cell division control protein 7
MAKARTSLQRHVEQIEVHEDDLKEQDAEETLDESLDQLESEHSSDEEVEQSVAEDMARFEETFVGINKRFRLINRIGEGMF